VDVTKRDEILDRYRERVREFDRTARTRAGQGGATVLPLPAPATEPGRTLTMREAEVLQLLADGLSNLEIARRLVVAEETAKTHVRHLLGKLGARSRAHAVALGFRHGLLS
jgi:DNA-binding NarL/FixJ family response regulator